MKWLLTAPTSESSVFEHYIQWAEGGGVATEVIRPSRPLPLADDFAALLLTGEADIDPGRYGQARHPLAGDPQFDRDHM